MHVCYFARGGTVLWIWQNSFCLDFWCICTCESVQLRFIEFAFHGIIEIKCRQAVAWRNGSIVHGSNQMNKKENIITRIFLIYKSLLIQILWKIVLEEQGVWVITWMRNEMLGIETVKYNRKKFSISKLYADTVFCWQLAWICISKSL